MSFLFKTTPSSPLSQRRKATDTKGNMAAPLSLRTPEEAGMFAALPAFLTLDHDDRFAMPRHPLGAEKAPSQDRGIVMRLS